MENQVETFVIVSSVTLVFFILSTVYLVVKLKLNDKKLKKSEEKLRLLNLALEGKVEAQTQELTKSETQYHTLYELHREVLANSPAGIVKFDDQMVIEFANPELNTILGNSGERHTSITDMKITDIALFNNPSLNKFFSDLTGGYESKENLDFIAKNKKHINLNLIGVPIQEDNKFT